MRQLNEIDEMRQEALKRTGLVKQQRSGWHDKYIKKSKFHPGDWALPLDSKLKNFQGKFHTHYLGPYEVENVFDNGVIRIKSIYEEKIPLLLNGNWLRLFEKPLKKEQFDYLKTFSKEITLVELGRHVLSQPMWFIF